jgi:hypothetical protein
VPIPRRLSYRDDSGKTQTITQGMLLGLELPAIILGEPGMGKSTLLTWLASEMGVPCFRASTVIEEQDWGLLASHNRPILVDAFDEVVVRNDGDSIARLVPRLRQAKNPPFVFACRSREWLSSSSSSLTLLYGQPPKVLTLEAIQFHEAVAYATEKCPSIANVYDEMLRLRELGLGSLLETGLTLEMVVKVLQKGQSLPTNRRALFEMTCRDLWFEHAKEHSNSPLAGTSTEAALDAVGAISAALLLSGSAGVARVKAHAEDGDLLLPDFAMLPRAESAPAVFSSKLFKTISTERIEPVHRVLQEFMAARWLTVVASTPRARKRIVSHLQGGGGVPAALRGLHAWLASLASDLARDLISADPFGMLRYGEAGELDDTAADYLLSQLLELSVENPDFRQRDRSESHSARGLARPALMNRIENLILNTETAWQLRWLLIEALNGYKFGHSTAEILIKIIMSPSRVFRERHDAIASVFQCRNRDFWLQITASLRDLGDEDSTRLAVTIIKLLNCDVEADLLLTSVLADLGFFVCAVPQRSDDRANAVQAHSTIAARIPTHRLMAVLDSAVAFAGLVGKGDSWPKWEWASFCERLLVRMVAELDLGQIAVSRLWGWLGLLQSARSSRPTGQEIQAQLTAGLLQVRPALQAYAAFEAQGFSKDWFLPQALSQRCVGIEPGDILSFIARHFNEPSNDARRQEVWRILMRGSHGQDKKLDSLIREAGASFCGADGSLQAELAQFENPVPADWEVEDQERRERFLLKEQERFAKHRQEFLEHIHEIKLGNLDWILGPVQAYLGMYGDIRGEQPEDRLANWLGQDLAAAAFDGFEACLRQRDLPTAAEVATKLTEGIVPYRLLAMVAALVARWRTGKHFADLPDSILSAVMHYTIHYNGSLHHSGADGLNEALEIIVLRSLGDRIKFAKEHIEPGIANGSEHITFLSQLTEDEPWQVAGLQLVELWLTTAVSMHDRVKRLLLRFLLRKGSSAQIDKTLKLRLEGGLDLSTGNGRLWRTVSMVTGSLTMKPQNPDWFSTELDPIGDVSSVVGAALSNGNLHMSSEFVSGTFEHFRSTNILNDRHGRHGANEEQYQASQFLRALIGLLAMRIDQNSRNELRRLLDAPEDTWTPILRLSFAEQSQKAADEAYKPLSPAQLANLLADGPPSSVNDLRALVVSILSDEQRRLQGDETDPIRMFWTDDGQPRGENECRDILAYSLMPRLEQYQVRLMTEADMPENKRVDMGFAIEQIQLPVELKGQWNRALWTAAAEQLDRQYLVDWRSEGQGIYLVLWFGSQSNHSRKLQPSPGCKPSPRTPEELKSLLIEFIPEDRRSAIEVIVLDLARSR